jgi:hypothetical protein
MGSAGAVPALPSCSSAASCCQRRSLLLSPPWGAGWGAGAHSQHILPELGAHGTCPWEHEGLPAPSTTDAGSLAGLKSAVYMHRRHAPSRFIAGRGWIPLSFLRAPSDSAFLFWASARLMGICANKIIL